MGLKGPVCRATRREDRLGDGRRRAPEGAIAGADRSPVVESNQLESLDQI
jgi:hypothetical protein